VSGGARPDPRPQVREEDGAFVLVAAACGECGYVVAGEVPACPLCGGVMRPAAAGPRGRVWAATVVRIPVPGRAPPYGLAYVDLENGPRVLAHTPGEQPLAVGLEVELAAPGAAGDLEVVPT
jgi:uncharacterized OB-fold protein